MNTSVDTSTATSATTITSSQPSQQPPSTLQSLEPQSPGGIKGIPFAVKLPTTTLQDIGEPTPRGDTVSLMGDHGIVGSIVLMGQKSAMIYVGWGQLQLSSSSHLSLTNKTEPNVVRERFGTGAPTMGPLVLAMPRTQYRGAFGTGANEPSCSQLIGSISSEDQMLANQMASRLSARSGMAIFVSCQLSNSTGGGGSNGLEGRAGGGSDNNMMDSWTSGLDSDMISHKAAALAEREIWRILQEHQQQAIK
ncbi:proteasome assembly chaperone 4 [Nitzschia inconspicua]|uniref:Proteasome assembly chaperone 4 n=1 Tax=Nitzschia inconspicua TaxID=303405 RepID=A0A9K3L6N4_9STRA|nr:proteasome assembly chaperone 4 [Nitzschia inconspicua]